MTTRFTDETGGPWALDRRLGGGGEGEVHSLQGEAGLVAKVFFPTRRSRDTHEKLRAMIARPPPGAHDLVDGYPVLSWPQNLLYADPRRKDAAAFAGYTMRRVEVQREFVPLYQVVSSARRGPLGNLPWDKLVLLALRICHVVRTLHRMDYAVGDLNDRNVLVSRRLTPLFLDTDSFQVPRAVLGHYPCAVADRLYWPPELLKVDLATYRSSRVPADRYALAVLLFQLLMNGMRPYQSRGRLVEDLESIERKTQAGHYPWTDPKPGVLEPPAGAPRYSSLPAPIRRAFEDAFVRGHHEPRRRPSADDWYRALKKLHDGGFQTCPGHPEHRYGTSERRCPWCGDPNDPFLPHARPAPTGPRRRPKPVMARAARKPAATRRRAARAPRPSPAPKKAARRPAKAPSRRNSAKWVRAGAWNSGVAAAYFSPLFVVAQEGWSTSVLLYLSVVAALVPLAATCAILPPDRRRTMDLRFLLLALLSGAILTGFLAWRMGWAAVGVEAGLGHLLIGYAIYERLERSRRSRFNADGRGAAHAAAGLVAAYLPLALFLAVVG